MSVSLIKSNVSHRLAQELRESIKAGVFPVGSKLPTTRELAGRYEVSLNAIQGAFRELEILNLIECKPRQGTYVRAGACDDDISADEMNVGQVGVIRPLSLGETQEGDSWNDRIVSAAERTLHPEDYHLAMLSYHPKDPDFEGKLLPRVECMASRLSGVLITAPLKNAAIPDLLNQKGIPWVSINPVCGYGHNFVSADNLNIGRAVGLCFARKGYERVLLLSMRGVGKHPVSDTEKVTGFIRGYVEAGVQLRGIDIVSCNDWREAYGYEKTLEHIEKHSTPQAIFATGDLLSLGAMRACRKKGLSIPGDVGVIGATGTSIAEHSNPPLTVIAQPMNEMGARAAQMLMEMIDKGIRRMIGCRIQGRFVLRDSLKIDDAIMQEIQRDIFSQSNHHDMLQAHQFGGSLVARAAKVQQSERS